MKLARLLPLLMFPLAAFAADHTLKVDKTRSYVEVDVDATKNFTAHLDKYDAKFATDDAGKIKGAVLTFKFTDLKTGKTDRDADMIKWLGGGDPEGKFELGILALAPDGQGQVSGRFTMHGETQRLEFPVNVTKTGDTYTITGLTQIDYRDWKLKVIRKAMLFTVDSEVQIRFKFTALPPEPFPETK